MILLRDELIGFAKSRVMLVLWVVLPLLSLAVYLVLPHDVIAVRAGHAFVSATGLVGIILSSVAGLVSSLMVAVDIVSERNRKVYELFVIRPIRREAIIWAKFLAVFGCVTVACVVSIAAGLVLDVIRGATVDSAMLLDVGRSLLTLIYVIAISAGVGVLFGVMSRSILVAVLLILYVGQNLAIVPMLPVYFGWLPQTLWIVLGISTVLTALLVWGATFMFRRTDI